MTNLIPFTNSKFGSIRVIDDNGTIWFCGKDVANGLGYKDPVNALKQHCRGVAIHHPIVDSLGREQQARFITEGDLYRLIASSKLPSAQEFESWIFDEVLPSIRKHGGYLTDQKIEDILTDPDTIIELATKLKSERAKRAALEKQAAIDTPKARVADAVSASHTSILIGDLAKLLRQNGYEIGQNRLFEMLRRDGYLCAAKGGMWNMPTQKAMDLNLFEVKETTIVHSDGHVSISKTTKVTGKGQVYFVTRFLDGRLPKGINEEAA